jgi:hypothetical protein
MTKHQGVLVDATGGWRLGFGLVARCCYDVFTHGPAGGSRTDPGEGQRTRLPCVIRSRVPGLRLVPRHDRARYAMVETVQILVLLLAVVAAVAVVAARLEIPPAILLVIAG